ncbi:Fibronectin type III domain protein [Drechmeria coniospora]|uniref:Fibronectin type III domain protein n=1 Tax=Drechmeria coniospora TaxID=98403 RepID=A0A151GC62_DRECN|nr:Fibronectin type III domain protein [Drechmeria coniospora]KYK54689.1 Fibronectin type III domain protein [Drechmeria coniospora]
MSWEPPSLTIACILTFGLLWCYRNVRSATPGSSPQLHLALTGLAILVDYRTKALRWCESTYDATFNATPIEQLKMALTLGAIVWLLHRSWQTLWKPVPELVNILGVDIPHPPDVCLAGIGADSASLTWTRHIHRPVQRYMIQVNGVIVGESPANETAITVTGLKPNHFYNIRVFAIGPNNFRAASPLIRLRTFGRDGRPQLGSARLPASFVDHDQPRAETSDDSDYPDKAPASVPAVEAAAVLDKSAALPRDSVASAPGQRRNTLNRRHSPSVASADQPQIRSPTSSEPEMSLAELNERFEGIRKEIDDTLALYAKDEADSQQQEEELKKDRDRKRQALKEKEEQTLQLKAMLRMTMEQMRAAEKDRSKKEQQLKDKEMKKSKIRDSAAKFEHEVERMKADRDGFQAQKAVLMKSRDREVKKLDQDNAELQDNCAKLEAELKDKGKQLQDIKATRELLPGADNEQWKDEDLRLRREWEFKRRDIHNRLVAETKSGHILDQQVRALSEQLSMQQQAGLAFYAQPDSSMLEFEPSPAVQHKRLSRGSNSVTNAILSSPDRAPSAELKFQTTGGFGNPSFAPRLFTDVAPGGTSELAVDVDLKAGSGPLSPSAQTLLPSNIFEESEDTDAMESKSPILPESITAGEDPPQSPASSSMSFPAFSSPHGSSHNLPFPQYADNNDRQPLPLNSSPTPPSATGHKIASFLSTFQRGRGSKASDDDGPPIGTLKSEQSQSFPTTTDESEILAGKRRLNFSSWMGRSSMGPDNISPGPSVGTSRPFSSLRFNPLRGSATVLPNGDHDASRPASIASTDLPRPSTDSGSIWGAPGDALGLAKNRPWSPSDGRWPSRSGSRRPSLQGSNALTTTLASADDVILDEHDLMKPENRPNQVGVIGSRPPGNSKSLNQGLNPAAPTFMGQIFGKDRGRDKEAGTDKDRAKARDRGRGKDVSRDDKSQTAGSTTPGVDAPPSLDDSPADSRISRDAYSVHTQTSVSESHESLQLDGTVSNPASDVNSPSAQSAKDPENVVRKLFRKGSFGKFSLSSRLGKESGLFKKGPGSTSNSDKNMSADHRSSIGDLDEPGDDGALLGRSYDSMSGSPSLGPSKSKDGREAGRMSTWRFSMSSMKKKGKETAAREKESMEMDRAPEEGMTNGGIVPQEPSV